jgi:5,10-methylenetetrahydromethanopterin reductase
MTCEFWMHWFPIPGQVETVAERAEERGFDGLLLADSQNLVGDPFVALGILAKATTHLGLGTGIVNPLTRHPAVVASAMASLQIETGGRAALGVGRGDSSLAQIGLRPPSTNELGVFVSRVRGFLRADTIDLDGTPSRLTWLNPSSFTPPPVELAATGPRTIALAATISDRLMLTLGADPNQVSAAITLARQARVAHGLDPATLRVGAYINIACTPNLAQARDLVRGSTAIFAHFASMRAAPPSPDQTAHDATTISALGTNYDAATHGLSTARNASSMDDPFIDRFAIVGSAQRCRTRLAELIRLGLDRIVLVPGSRDSDPQQLDHSNRRIAADVLPALR